MNIKELKINLLLLGFGPKTGIKHHWIHPEIKKYTINFSFYQTIVGKTKIDNRETMQPILDKIMKRIKQHEFKRI